MTTLRINRVNKHYKIKSQDNVRVLKNIELSFESGEMVAIVGESGSGKSTLMNVLGGLDSDFSGEVLLDEKNIAQLSEKERVRYHKEKVGFIFQNFNLIPHLSVLDNVMLSMTLSNVGKRVRIQRAKETLMLVGLEKQFHKKPNQLSGGQKQRVAIARALVNDPDIIIADEPTGSLDAKTTNQILGIIEDIAKSGKLVLIVTHSEQVAKRCSRRVTISDGMILDDVTSATSDLESQCANIFAYEHKPKHRHLNLFAAFRLALKNMREKWLRNVLITMGSSIGIMSIILMLSLGEGVNGYLVDTMTSTVNPVVTQVHMPTAKEQSTDPTAVGLLASQGGVTGMAKDIIIQDPPFEPENIEELQQIEGVEAVERGFQSTRLGGNTLAFDEQAHSYMNLQSISSAVTEANILEGTLPKTGEIMITERFAKEIGAPLGKRVELKTIINGVDVAGTYTVSGIFTSGDSISPTALTDGVYLNYTDIEALARSKGITFAPNVLYLVTSDATTNARLKEQIHTMGYARSTTDSITDIFSQMITLFTYILAGVAGISLVVSAILITTVLFISVVERTNEIGIIKAIGGRCQDIRRIFVSEALLLGLFSGLIAVSAAAVVAIGINSFTRANFDAHILFLKPEFAIAGVLISVLISMLAGMLPAARAAKLDPVESLRHE